MSEKLTISQCIEWQDCAYIAAKSKRIGWIKSEVQPSDYWVGGDEGGYTNDSNIYFETPESAEEYYNRTYTEVHVFEDEYDCEDYLDEVDPQ